MILWGLKLSSKCYDQQKEKNEAWGKVSFSYRIHLNALLYKLHIICEFKCFEGKDVTQKSPWKSPGLSSVRLIKDLLTKAEETLNLCLKTVTYSITYSSRGAQDLIPLRWSTRFIYIVLYTCELYTYILKLRGLKRIWTVNLLNPCESPSSTLSEENSLLNHEFTIYNYYSIYTVESTRLSSENWKLLFYQKIQNIWAVNIFLIKFKEILFYY